MTAPQAAGVIHSDFEKGFIRAETIAFTDFVKVRGWEGAHARVCWDLLCLCRVKHSPAKAGRGGA